MKIGLYKNGKLVDFGVVSKIKQYRQLGYEVRQIKGPRATYDHAVNEFIELWDNLSYKNKSRFRHIITGKMSIYSRLNKLRVIVAKVQPPAKTRRESLLSKFVSLFVQY